MSTQMAVHQTKSAMSKSCIIDPRRYQTLAVEHLGEMRSFKTSKFHAHGKYAPLIRWLGCALLASASPGEATHKVIKAGYLNSNKKAGGLEEQVWPSFCQCTLLMWHCADVAQACCHDIHIGTSIEV